MYGHVVCRRSHGRQSARHASAQARAEWGNLLITAAATDGQPLQAREGRIALQSTADFRLGARHVRNFLRIELSAVAP